MLTRRDFLLEGAAANIVTSTYRSNLYATQPRLCALTFPKFSLDDIGDSDLTLLLGKNTGILELPKLTATRLPKNILESSKVVLDEKGISTSSVTVAYGEIKTRIANVLQVKIDHPFSFTIVDDINKRVLYLGTVSEL